MNSQRQNHEAIMALSDPLHPRKVAVVVREDFKVFYIDLKHRWYTKWQIKKFKP
jgi:hypothetical protein